MSDPTALNSPDATLAPSAAERLRLVIEETPFPTEQAAIHVTISVVVAQSSDNVQTIAQLLEPADQQPYAAKRVVG